MVVVTELLQDGGGGIDAAGSEVVDGADLEVSSAGELFAAEPHGDGAHEGTFFGLERGRWSHEAGFDVGFGLLPDGSRHFRVGPEGAGAFNSLADPGVSSWW